MRRTGGPHTRLGFARSKNKKWAAGPIHTHSIVLTGPVLTDQRPFTDNTGKRFRLFPSPRQTLAAEAKKALEPGL